MDVDNFLLTVLQRFKIADKKFAFDVYDGVSVTQITYRQFLSDILKVTGYFTVRKIREVHIALAAQNSYEWIVILYAILVSGNVAVPMNPEMPTEELQQKCDKADIGLAVTDHINIKKLACQNQAIGILEVNELFQAEPASLEKIDWVNSDKTALLISTSGTTGDSKIAEFTIKNVRSVVQNYFGEFSRVENRRPMMTLPLHHVAGLVAYAFCPLYTGGTICIGRGIQYIVSDMPVLQPTQIVTVPSLLGSIVKLLKACPHQGHVKYLGEKLKLIYVCAAPPNPDDIRFITGLGLNMGTIYAMTEVLADGLGGEINADSPKCVGQPYGDMQCKIKDGEILLRNASLMKGYYNDPKETLKVIEDGWLHTGDLGYCDECGNYYITGRKKNTIILSNGENVNPEEIEAAWGRCEAIQECLVYADEKGICADVFTSDPEQVAQFIRAYNEHVPRYHQVYKVFYSDCPLEKTSSGKLKRKGNKA